MIARRQTIVTIVLISAILLAAHPVSCDDVTWTSKKTHTLDKGDAFSVGAFTVKATDFDGVGSVVLEIKQNTEEETGEVVEILLTKGEVWDNDNIRLECTDATDKDDLESIGRYPWYPEAKIISWVADRKTPDITLDISLDGSEYRYDDTITAEITAENDGDGDLREGMLNITLDGLYLADGGQLSRIGTINPDDSRSVTVKLRFKAQLADGDIRVMLTGKDEGGVEYHAAGSKTVGLKPPLVVRKFATPDIYWGETVYVSLSAKNVQNYEVSSITLIDEVSDHFMVKNDLDLNWTFDLRPDEEKTFYYHLIPDMPGSFTLPAASASCQIQEMDADHGASSDRPSTVVHGAFMGVVKTVKPDLAIGETVNVTIEVTNTGDLPAYVSLTDQLPANTTYVSGRTNFTGFIFMRSHETERVSYAMRIDSPDVNIPEPVVKFKETVYAGRIMNYTGNYEVMMPATLATEVSAVTPIPGPGDVTPPDPSPPDPSGVRVNGAGNISETDPTTDAGNETTLRRINVGAKELQQKIDSLKTMAMPGFGGAWLVAAIMVAYVIAIRRIL